MVRRVLVCAALVASMSACGGGSGAQPGGAAEPEKLVKAFAAAAERRDVAAMRRLMVSPARIEKALDCPGAENLANDVAQVHQAMDALETLKSGLPDTKLTVASMTEDSRATVARGGSFHGCTAREDFEARTYRVELRAEALDEETEERHEMIRLDNVWWMLPIS